MKLNLLEERDRTVHIYELVSEGDLIHVDSVRNIDNRVVERITEYLDECGCTEIPEITHFVDQTRVLDVAAAAIDSFGISDRQEIVQEIYSYMRIKTEDIKIRE